MEDMSDKVRYYSRLFPVRFGSSIVTDLMAGEKGRDKSLDYLNYRKSDLAAKQAIVTNK